LYDAAISNPVAPKVRGHFAAPGVPVTHVVKHCPLRGAPDKRQYFERHQSMPELLQYYKTHKGVLHRGFAELASAVEQEGPVSRPREALPGPKRKESILSDTNGPNYLDLPVLPKRHVAGGRMRDPSTGRIVHWDHHLTAVAPLKDYYHNGLNSLRCPGTPPRHLYADEYYDDGE